MTFEEVHGDEEPVDEEDRRELERLGGFQMGCTHMRKGSVSIRLPLLWTKILQL